PFLGRDPADEGEIVSTIRVEGNQIPRQAMMDGARKVRPRNRFPLVVGNRDELHLGEGRISRPEIGQVLPSVQGGEAFVRQMAEGREMQEVDMEMEDVIAPGLPPSGGQ